MSKIITFSDGFSSASAPVVDGTDQESYLLDNNQPVTSIAGLIFDSLTYKSVFFDYEIERIGDITYRQSGQLIAIYNGSWSLSASNYTGEAILSDSLEFDYNIVLSIDSSSGQIKYQSGDQSGHVSTKIKLNILKVAA